MCIMRGKLVNIMAPLLCLSLKSIRRECILELYKDSLFAFVNIIVDFV